MSYASAGGSGLYDFWRLWITQGVFEVVKDFYVQWS